MGTDNTVCGIHAVLAALRDEAGEVSGVWIDQDRGDPRIRKIAAVARERGVAIHHVPRARLEELAGGVRHQGVVARCRGTAPLLQERDLEQLLEGLEEPAFLLVLDGVQDPHNLGACLRSADAAGSQCVVVPRDRAASLTPAVRKVAAGAAEHVPLIQVTNLARTLRSLKAHGIWIVGTSTEAETSVYQADLRGPVALVLGSEHKGLRRLTRDHCDTLVRIPLRGAVDSLNVSVAAGVCLFEALRQRAGIP